MHYLVPQFVVDNYHEDRWRGRLFAVCLFADISGFSTITDGLMEHGPHGAETLAGLMRNVFDPLIGSVYEYGGFVATLAGDAFTAVFPATADSESGRRQAAARAIAAAWHIQERMATVAVQQTTYGDFNVSAKVGAACGELIWGIVASEDGRRAAYYFQGPAIDGSAQAEHAASAGEIIYTLALHALVESLVTAQALNGEGQHFRLLALGDSAPVSQPVSAPTAGAEVMSRFFPAGIVNQEHSGEFRQVLNLFINLPTVRTEDQLDIFMRSVFTLQDRYGGLLNRVDFGDKGSNLLLFWGAPVTYENDVARALSFILSLQASTSIPISAGVTYRIAHAGFIGSPLREEYTCYGRGVNLAARFMTVAPRGEIWLDEHVARLAQREFNAEFEGRMKFKGFADEQKVYVLFETKEDAETFYDGPMVGRQPEIDALAAFVAPLWHDQPAGMMIVWGESGMGKSRLVHEFERSDLIRKEKVLWALCQCDEILRQSLNPFRYWLRRYFKQSNAQSESRNKRYFNRKLDGLIDATENERMAAELDRTRSFLGATLDLFWPDSLYEGLDPSGRYENTMLALQVLLQAESLRQPLIVQLEDLHVIDEDSRELLLRLSGALKPSGAEDFPIAIIATSRREGPGCPLPEGERCQEIDLAELPPDSISDLAREMLGGAIAGPLLELIATQAEGNPFFAEQLVRYLEESDLLVEGNDGWQAKRALRHLLPADVRSVLSARLDRLAQEVKDVVQTAAVLGREFEVALLIRMLRDEQATRQGIVIAEEAAIWSALNQMRYLFKHALLRDTAYRMQVRARRQQLHLLAADGIETLYSEDLSPHYGELGYHNEHAARPSQAADWYILAGEQARSRGTLVDARTYLDRALALIPANETSKRWSALIKQIDVLNTLGDTDLSYKEATAALALAQEMADEARMASAYHQLGSVAYYLGDPHDALKNFDAGLALSRRSGDQRTEALLMGMKTAMMAQLGRNEDAAIVAEGTLVLAEELGDDSVLVRILNNLAHFHMSIGDFGRAAELLTRQIDLNRSQGELVGEAHGLTNLAYNQVLLGQYELAQEAIARAMELTMAMGARRLTAYNQLNLGLAQIRLSRPAEARQEIEAARRVLVGVDDKFGVAASHSYMGLALESDAQYEPAAASYEIAAEMMHAISAAGYAVDATAGRSRCALLLDETTLAEKLADEVWQHLRQSGPGGLEFPLLAYESCGRVFEAAGKEEALREVVQAGYRQLMEWAQRISDRERRTSYLNNVPEHSVLIQRWRKLTS